MKRKRFRRILCVLLAAVMTVSLCACGDESANGESVNNDAAKQHVYAASDIDLGVEMDQVGMYSMSCYNGRVYTILEDYNNLLEGGEGADAEVMPRSATEESVAAEVSVDIAVEEVPPVDESIEEYVYTGPSYYLVSVNLDGTDRQTAKLILPETIAMGSYGYMSTIRILQDATVAAVYETYYEDYSDPENPIYGNYYYLIKWDEEGNCIWSKEIIPDPEDEYAYFYAQGMISDEQGNLILISGEGQIISYDAQGNETSRVDMNESETANRGALIAKNDGTVYQMTYNDDWTKTYISTLDPVTGQMGEQIELPEGFTSYSIYGGSNTDLLLSNSMGIYTYNIGDAEPTKIMDFINSDLATYGLNNITILDDKNFVANYHDSIDYKSHIAKFTYVDPADIPDKKTVTLGCYYLGSDTKQRVINYNKTNSQYRITVKSYMDGNDYDTGLTQMNNDIISGQMPDIMIVESSQDISSWVKKGLLADIEELIKNDEELSNVEFIDNIWDAFRIDGKLYLLIPEFAVQTMTARKSLVGDRTGWTMTEFQQFMDTMEEDVTPFGNDMLRNTLIYYLMMFCGSDFVDINTGTCNFESEEFIAMLEYANTFPAEYPENYWEDYDWQKEQGKYREGKAILQMTYVSRISDLIYQIHGNLGEEAAWIGFPGLEGNSSVIQPGSYMYAISSQSKNTEGAWDFVRYYLTDEYQNNENMYNLPVVKKIFEEKAKESMEKPYWLDENGEKVEYDNTYYINGEEIVLEQFSQEEVDSICEFIYSLGKRSYYNENITNIVTEEAESFFSGDKSAQEVAKVIQSRVQVYVDENR